MPAFILFLPTISILVASFQDLSEGDVIVGHAVLVQQGNELLLVNRPGHVRVDRRKRLGRVDVRAIAL